MDEPHHSVCVATVIHAVSAKLHLGVNCLSAAGHGQVIAVSIFATPVAGPAVVGLGNVPAMDSGLR